MNKNRKRISLNTRLAVIALAVFIPLSVALAYSIYSMSEATSSYSEITKSITCANDSLDFKETMDYSVYLAVVRKESFWELGKGEVTVNGIVTVNPYEYISDMKMKCGELSDMASVEVNHNLVTRLSNTLDALTVNVRDLERSIQVGRSYEDNMDYLDENIYMLTTVVEEGIQEYIETETAQLQRISHLQEKHDDRIWILSILIAALAVYVAVILTVRVIRNITEPIRRICGLTEKVSEGDFSVRVEGSHIQEIQVLADSFNSMTGEIGTLVDDIKEKEKNLHLIETRLLQEQINPHFLYNTLDAIVWLAEDNRNEDVIAMVTYLSNFFRTTLAQGRDFVTVEEEESHIESYLRIQGVRYQDIMEYEIDMERDIYNYEIPKLLLQPLVENALYHGVKNKRGKSRIFVWGYQEGDNLIFKVNDNGKGMSRETLEKLRKNIEKGIDQTENDSFGLANVNQRIKYYYGEEYGLEIESEENVGTEAVITLSAKKSYLYHKKSNKSEKIKN